MKVVVGGVLMLLLIALIAAATALAYGRADVGQPLALDGARSGRATASRAVLPCIEVRA